MRTRIFLSLLAFALCLPLGAQSFQESLFLNNYRLGYRYNPALQADGDFISIGEFSLYSANNVGASAFLYPRGNELVTGLHPSVSTYDFISSLKDLNQKQSHVNYSLFAYGFRTKNAFHTVEISARGMYGAAVPKEFFRFLKQGGEEVYSFAGTRLQGQLYAELAYGYSRKIGDKLSFGVRPKLLLGLYAADYKFTRFNIHMTGEGYQMNIETALDLTNRSGKMETSEEGYLQLLKWQAKDKWRLPSGVGLALDLGLLWEPVDGLALSLSLTDLGGLFWHYGNAGTSKGDANITLVNDLNYEDINFKGLVEQVKILGEKLLQPISLKPADRRFVWKSIPFQANAAIRYKMPFYRPLSLGFTGNYSAFEGLPYAEGRFALGVNPLSWLDITGSAGYGTYGAVWGAAIQVRVLRFRLHAAYQDGFGGTIPYKSTPLKANGRTIVIGLTYDI